MLKTAENVKHVNLPSTSCRLHDRLSSNVFTQRKDQMRDETNLWYDANSLSQTVNINMTNVLAVDEYTSRLRVVEPIQQAYNCWLTVTDQHTVNDTYWPTTAVTLTGWTLDSQHVVCLTNGAESNRQTLALISHKTEEQKLSLITETNQWNLLNIQPLTIKL